MHRMLWVAFFIVVVAVATGVGVALGVHFAGLAHGMTISVDGEVFEGTIVAAVLGVTAALAILIAGVVVTAVVASLAIAVPIAVAALLLAVAIALVAGLSPVLIPVLLVVGAYALLTRDRRRTTVPPQPVAHSS